jgi:ABC-type dipeptide/oligopeptide/nickel transport system permease subunit
VGGCLSPVSPAPPGNGQSRGFDPDPYRFDPGALDRSFPRDDIGLNRTRLPPMSADPVTGQLHILGTDHLGRDFFTRVIYAARVSLMVAISVTTLVAIIGTTLGLLAGFFGGWVDNTISRIMEFVATIPDLPILLILSAIMIQNADLIVLPSWIIGPVAWIMAVPNREATQVALLILVLASLGWVGRGASDARHGASGARNAVHRVGARTRRLECVDSAQARLPECLPAADRGVYPSVSTARW